MTTRVHVAGEVLAPEVARISVFDHGFLFGHSVYEVVRTYQKVPFELTGHLARLARSAEALEIPLPASSAMLQAVRETLAAAGNPEAYIRIVVTRGIGDLNISPESCTDSGLLVFVKDWPGFPERLYEEGISIIVAQTGRMEIASMDPSVKSGNYANSIAALLDAQRQGARDALMLGAQGEVTEGTTSNVFCLRGRSLLTPALDAGILAGITRAAVLDLARGLGLDCLEQDFDLETLLSADEVFFSSTLKEVMPVTRIGNRVIGNGLPGPRTRELRAAYGDRVLKSVAGESPWW